MVPKSHKYGCLHFMWIHAEALLGEIERNRLRMVRLAGQLGFTHPDVIGCSEKLDKLLMEYYQQTPEGGKSMLYVPVTGIETPMD
jgi:hypothetical protein